MATIIEQKPLYTQTPVGQDVIFVVSNSNIVSTKTRVKFQAEVHISNTFSFYPIDILSRWIKRKGIKPKGVARDRDWETLP